MTWAHVTQCTQPHTWQRDTYSTAWQHQTGSWLQALTLERGLSSGLLVVEVEEVEDVQMGMESTSVCIGIVSEHT